MPDCQTGRGLQFHLAFCFLLFVFSPSIYTLASWQSLADYISQSLFVLFYYLFITVIVREVVVSSR